MFRPPPAQGIRLRIHHMGELLQTPFKLYVKGKVDEMDWEWDVDYINHYKLEELVKCEEHYNNIKCMWYWFPKYSFQRGLRPLNCDDHVLQFVKDMKDYEVADIYVEHKVDTPVLPEDGDGHEVQNKVI